MLKKPFEWNQQRERAAALLAEGGHFDPEIGREVGVSARTIRSWKHEPVFTARIAELTGALAQVQTDAAIAISTGFAISDKQQRVARLQERVDQIDQIRRARATAYADRVPGGETGLFAQVVKVAAGIGEVITYEVDHQTIRDEAKLLRQAAEELGQLKQTVEVSGSLDLLMQLLDTPQTVSVEPIPIHAALFDREGDEPVEIPAILYPALPGEVNA